MNEAAWYRVPQWIGGRLTGDHVATDAEAWVDLLGRWHQGEDVSACAFQKATAWGKGRVLAFMPKVAVWAAEAGASMPKSWSDRVADRPTDRKRTEHRTNENKDVPAKKVDVGPETDRASDRKRTASCARDPFKREEEIKIERGGEEPPPLNPPKAHAPADPGRMSIGRKPAPEQGVSEVKFGPSISPPPKTEETQESPLLPLLVNAGMNLGAASAVINAFRLASVLTLTDAATLDEWDLGRIVGINRKVATVKAFRSGGWVPPKERRTGPSAMPPSGAGTVLDADGRVLPAQVVVKASKKDGIMSELQRLAAEEVSDGQSSSNY